MEEGVPPRTGLSEGCERPPELEPRAGILAGSPSQSTPSSIRPGANVADMRTSSTVDADWPVIQAVLEAVTQKSAEPAPYKENVQLETVGARATKGEGTRIADWLALRLQQEPGSTDLDLDVQLKTLAAIITLAEYGNGSMKHELAAACLQPAQAKTTFDAGAHPIYGSRPVMLVRSSALEACKVLRKAAVDSAKMTAESERQQALALDSRASLQDLVQTKTRAGFVSTPKSKKEEKKHQKMFREMEKTEEKRNKEEKRAALERATNAKIWATEILPHFAELQFSKKVDALLWEAIPFSVRGQVWTAAIGNASNVSATSYTERCAELDSLMAADEKPKWVSDIAVDLSRTFSTWVHGSTAGRKRALYEVASERAKDGDECLRKVLGSYALYNPGLGYTQGMSYIVAMLLLYNPPREAFQLLVNLLDKSMLMCMFEMDHVRMQNYWNYYDDLMKRNLPQLKARFDDLGIGPFQYLMDWFFTLFSRTVPLELSSMLWDHFVMHGDPFLFRAALGILKLIQERLMVGEFEDVSWTLKNLSLSDSDHELLTKSIRAIVIPDEIAHSINQVRRQ